MVAKTYVFPSPMSLSTSEVLLQMSPVVAKGQERTNPQVLSPRARTETIHSLAESIKTSITNFLASPSTQLNRDDLNAFLEGIKASAATVQSHSRALVLSGAVGDFIYFPKLPPELRSKIWKYSLEGLRMIEVYRKSTFQRRKRVFTLGVKQAPHPVFHVCQESRGVAMKKYTLQLSKSTLDLANTRIDPLEDLVYITLSSCDDNVVRSLGGAWFETDIWSDEGLKLERLEVDSRMKNSFKPSALLQTFEHAKSVTIIHHSERCQHELSRGSGTKITLLETPKEEVFGVSFILEWNLSFTFSLGLRGNREEDRDCVTPTILHKVLEYDGKRCCTKRGSLFRR
jgi:hypothetical protein